MIPASLAVLAAGVCVFLWPHSTIVVKGYLSPQELAAVKSLVKKDMAKRLLPKFSWADAKALPANLRAYFKYNIVEIDTQILTQTDVKVGDGATIESSKHVCEYILLKDANGWRIGLILSGRFPGPPGMSRIGYFPAPVSSGGARTAVAAAIPPRATRADVTNIGLSTNVGVPFATNIGIPRLTLNAPPWPRNFAPPDPPTNLAAAMFSNRNTVSLRPPASAQFMSAPVPITAATGKSPAVITFGSAGFAGRVMPPASGASLTNLMPVGK